MSDVQTPDIEAGPARRMGPAGSANWLAMLDGAEAVLREEGYAALTSRRVAERIGVKQRLVYYYFQTMDDLIVETFRRHAACEMAKLREAAASDRPLHRIWAGRIEGRDSRLISEFVALGHRIEPLKREVLGFVAAVRTIHVDAIAAAAARHPGAGAIPPVALAILANGAALTLGGEAALGFDTGHQETLGVIEAFLDTLEPGSD